MTRLPQLRDSLVRAAAQDARPAPARRGPRRSRTRLLVVGVGGVLALGGVAVAATTIIQTGAPVKSHGMSDLVGKIEPGSTRLLSLRVPDPDGGPPWGIRVFRTSGVGAYHASGLACLQVGRVVNGKLGILGQDGSFADDGKFHELPVEASSCGGLDARGQIFSGAVVPLMASGSASGPGCETRHERWYRTVEKPRTLNAALRLQISRGERQAARVQRRLLAKARADAQRTIPLCPARDQRTVAFGMVGSRARSVTATRGSTQMSLRPVGAESGPYLFLFRGAGTGGLQVRTLYPGGLICPAGDERTAPAGCFPPPGYQPNPTTEPNAGSQPTKTLTATTVTVQPNARPPIPPGDDPNAKTATTGP